DQEMRYLEVSRRWRTDYRVGDEPLIGRSHYEVFPEIPERWKAIHRRCLTGIVEGCEEDSFVRADGHTDWSRWEIRPWLTGEGEVGGIVLFSEDITARKQAEAAIRESEERFRVLANTAPVLIRMSGLDKRVSYVNTRWLQYTGRTIEQEPGDDWVAGVHPDDVDRCWKTYSEAFDRGEPFELEYRLRKEDGQYGWMHESGAPRFLPGGTFAGYHGACIDITARKLAEERLLCTRFAMDQAVDAVYWIDPNARILYTNDAARVMLGYTVEEFLRMTVHDLNPNFPPELWAEFWAETREKRVMSFETVHLAKDGRRIPTDIRVSFLAYGGQEFHCAFVRDITERKRVDEVLRQTQERFELAARATNDGIWDWNIVTGELYWSDRTFELLGLRPGDLTPSYEIWISMVHSDDADRAHQAVRHHLDTHEPYDIELRVRMKDGRYRWFRDQGQAVWDETGRSLRMVGSISDVTDRRNAEDALRITHAELEQRVAERTAQLALANRSLQDEITERKHVEEAVRDSELRYKLLTDATFDGIAIHDQGILIEVNAGLERIFRYGPGELIGRSLWDLVADESRDLVLANMQNGVNGPYEAMGRRKDGTTFFGEVVVRPCRYHGKEVRLVAGRDITERKHLEAERSRHTEELKHQIAERTAEIAKLESQRAQTEKLAAMGRLAAGVAHEINNPIAGIKNAFTLVKQAVDPAHPHAEFVGMIDREIARVASIVQNMYQLYRPESGKGEAVELRTMINDIEALFTKRLQQHQLLLAIDVDQGIDRFCVPRRDLLQVLLNLLNNAIDCSSEGGRITLTIRAESDAIRIAVSDQGPGISPEHLPHIFDPFFTTKAGGDQKGMGLGLSISQSLVMAMGGKIEVQTGPNDGSTFSVILPCHTAGACVQDQSNIIKEVVTP
ncbi:MAG TPA: PAS domain S-box protein, partial [Nitrospira sp.]|nr:PAS domain S-box protein [Nitrospira sp.]